MSCINQHFLLTFIDIYENTNLREENNFKQHVNATTLSHSINVAKMSCNIVDLLHINVDRNSLIRGALMHDYFLYDWHEKEDWHKWHGFNHPKIALNNAIRDTEINDIEKDIILKHMFPLTPFPPKTKEGLIVSISDKICAINEIYNGILVKTKLLFFKFYLYKNQMV